MEFLKESNEMQLVGTILEYWSIMEHLKFQGNGRRWSAETGQL